MPFGESSSGMALEVNFQRDGLPGRSPHVEWIFGPASLRYAVAGFVLHRVADEAWRRGESNPASSRRPSEGVAI
jgi:hypothetical protein